MQGSRTDQITRSSEPIKLIGGISNAAPTKEAKRRVGCGKDLLGIYIIYHYFKDTYTYIAGSSTLPKHESCVFAPTIKVVYPGGHCLHEVDPAVSWYVP